MINYSPLGSMVIAVNLADAMPWKIVTSFLTNAWLDGYDPRGEVPGIVEVDHTASGFAYLFDTTSERLIAAWGVSKGRHGAARDASRMAGHPLSAGPDYHRGHAIPHRLGGQTDINLVPQLGKVNIGAFRPLERQAVATPGSMYFTYWLYRGGPGQTPSGVDQGLLVAGRLPDIRRHGN